MGEGQAYGKFDNHDLKQSEYIVKIEGDISKTENNEIVASVVEELNQYADRNSISLVYSEPEIEDGRIVRMEFKENLGFLDRLFGYEPVEGVLSYEEHPEAALEFEVSPGDSKGAKDMKRLAEKHLTPRSASGARTITSD